MRKFVLLIVLSGVFTMFFGVTAFASAIIDTSGAENGTVSITLQGVEGKQIKAQVIKGEETYGYTLIKNNVKLPLQMGAGNYKVVVLDAVGDKYIAMAIQEFSVESINEIEMYKASIPRIEYSVSKIAIPAYTELVAGSSVTLDKITAIYNSIVAEYSYDFDMVSKVTTEYVPVIDEVYEAKKAICYGYSSVFAGALRSLDIPTRLVMGYVPEVEGYHAWNEVLIGDKWVSVDTTTDSQLAKGGVDYSMEKDRSKTQVVRVY